MTCVDDCRAAGCCGPSATPTPLPTANAPGRSRLRARVGTHAAFMAAMTERLASSDHPELAALTARAGDDLALALLDAWACIGDVLTFYSERIADEGYLGTATERLSLVELGRLVGYRPRPGLAASVWLAYTLDPDPDDVAVTVPAGSRVQSVPDPGGKPQVFETAEDLLCRPSWGVLAPRTRRPMRLSHPCVECREVVYIRGVATGLVPNDHLLFHFEDGLPVVRLVASVEVDLTAQVTAARLQPPGGAAAAGGCPDCDSDAPPPEPKFVRMEVLRAKAAPFGAAAPLKPPTSVINIPVAGPNQPPPAGATASTDDWELDTGLYDLGPNAGDKRRRLPLDADYPSVVQGSWIVVEARGKDPEPIQVEEVHTVGLATYGISGKATVLDLASPWFADPGTTPRLGAVRGVTAFVAAEVLTPADEPLTTPVAGRSIDLEVVVEGLPPGRRVVVTGESQGVATGEVARVLATRVVTDAGRPGSLPHTVLDLAAPLRHSYRRASVLVWGNAVRATHGETKDEPAVGSGAASQPNQRFTLSQHPLTYLATPDADGAEAALTVRVNGVAWHEVDELAWAGPAERAYEVSVDAAGAATFAFGDGRRGSRLPTGSGNVAARYRVGIGRPGNVRAGQLSQLQTKPLGVSAVTNPLRSSGGTDPDTDAALRRRAALPTLAMGRIVGLRDYEDFTLARAGIGKAAATRLVVARREVVQLTVAGVDDAPIDLDSDVLRGLLAACRRFGDPGVPVDAAPRTLSNLVVEARVGIEPDRSWALLEPQVRAALGLAFGFEARALAQSAYLAEAVVAVQAVQGVVFVDVTRFGATQGTAPADADAVTGTQPRVLARPALPAQDGIHADPAELVTVNPGLAGFVVLHGEVVR